MRPFVYTWLVMLLLPAVAVSQQFDPARGLDKRQTDGVDKQQAKTEKQQAARKPAAAKKAAAKKGAAGKRPLEITPALEEEVHAFVQQHHRELFELLIHLKEGLPKEYDRALRELYRAQQRLAQVQKRDPQRYEMELKLWQVQSRVRLLAARIQMSDRQSDESKKMAGELREALVEEYDLRAAVLRRERDRLAERLDKLNAQLEKLEGERDAALEKQLTSLTKPAPQRGGTVKTKNRQPPGRRVP